MAEPGNLSRQIRKQGTSEKWTEKRRHPRVDCHLEALLFDETNGSRGDYQVTVKDISEGGLSFRGDAGSGLAELLGRGPTTSLCMCLPASQGEVKAEGSVLRVRNGGQTLETAFRFQRLDNPEALKAMLERSSRDPFEHYFLAHQFETSLDGHKILKRSAARRLFQRIQNSVSHGNYTFQQEIDSVEGPTVVVRGRSMIMMSSYSYLGLLNDARVKKAAIEAIERFGTGASGVRLLSGTTALHRRLEEKIARIKGTEEALVYNSGFLTNQAIIASLFGRHDVIFVDYLAHQSIMDGCRLSGAEMIKFRHNDVGDLREKLERCPQADKRLIATDAVFSMDGDIAPVPEIVNLAREFGAITLVDEAHSLGVLGKTGSGVDEHFGLDPEDIDIHMGTLSKAIPSSGGYVTGKRDLIYYLKHASHPYIFSAALSPAETAAALEALEILRAGDCFRVRNLQENISYFSQGLKRLGFPLIPSESAILSIVIGNDDATLELSRRMNDRGVFVCPVLFPAVPRDKARIRNCVMATHSRAQLDHVLAAYEASGRELRLIPGPAHARFGIP